MSSFPSSSLYLSVIYALPIAQQIPHTPPSLTHQPKQRAVLDRQLTCPTARRNSPIPNLYTALLLKHLLPPPEAKDVDRAIVHAVCARLGGMGVSLPQKNWNKGVVVLTPKFWDAVGVGLGVASNSTTGSERGMSSARSSASEPRGSWDVPRAFQRSATLGVGFPLCWMS